MDVPKTKLDKYTLLETFKYLNRDDKLDLMKVNKKTRDAAAIIEERWNKEFADFNRDYLKTHGRQALNEFVKTCFNKQNKLYSWHFIETHPRNFTKERLEFIKLLRRHPFKEIETFAEYSEIDNEIKTRIREQQEARKLREEKQREENEKRKKLGEIISSEIYIKFRQQIRDLIEKKSLTEDVFETMLKELDSELKDDYLDDYVDILLKDVREKYSPQIITNDFEEIATSGEVLEPLEPKRNRVTEVMTREEVQIETIQPLNDFQNPNPRDISGVHFDPYTGILTANLQKNKKQRFSLIKECIKELLERPYTDYIYRYYFIGVGWRSIKLHGVESLKSLIEMIENGGLFNRFDLNESAFSTYYNEGSIPEPEYVEYLRIEPDPNKIVRDGNPEKATMGGEFYPYRYKLEVEVLKMFYEKAQITDSLSEINSKGRTVCKEMFNLNCICYALQQGGIPENVIDQVKIHCLNRYQKSAKLDKIFKSVGICAKVTREDKNSKKNSTKTIYIGAPLNNHNHYIELGLLREPGMLGDHYFFNDEIPVTRFFLKNFKEIKDYCETRGKELNTMFNKQRWNSRKNCYEVKGKQNSTISMLELLIWTRDNGYFEAYSMNDVLILPSNLYTCIKEEITNLNYNEECSLREIKSKIETKLKKTNSRCSKPISKFYYADFEASTQGFHKPYCCSYSSRDEDQIHTIWGEDCAWKLLNALEDNSLTYFHNLAYDGRFLAKYGIKQCIKKGGKLMSFKITYKGKNLQFRDSWAMISSKLSDFPAMFGIEGIQKELYPYNYYTQERVSKNIGVIDEAGKFEIVPWNDDQYKLFNENIDKIPGCRISENEFNMELYCKFYCEQDVNILKIGHTTFRDLVSQELNLDIDKSISISSLANKYFELNVYSKIPELYEYAGVVREYIQGCVKGGRCMTRQNKKWHCTETLYDYDACSLYPSAVHRLKLPTGKPIVIPSEWLGDSKYLLEHLMDEQQLQPSSEKFISAFIVDIDITKVGKELAFPIIMKKTKQGNSNCNECCTMRVDNNELEDLIKFQEIEFTIKQGYYWTGAKSDLFSNEMKRIYDLRVQYKKSHNPLQLVLKLLMNSTYGKTIQKPIKTELVYKQVHKEIKGKTYDEAARYNKKNAALIKEYYNISDNIVCFDVNKSFDDFFVPNLIGVQILSMSKRIMNEVMCLAEDLGIMIYYQDTDSMHIPVDKVPLLEQKYKELYGRELRGSDMGQFHPDFESDKIKGDLKSIESYFLGKKAYCDKLTNGNGEYDYHLRLKGIPNNLLESEYDDPLELYKFMYNGGEYKFNLLKLRPSFEMTKDMKIKSRTEFNRRIKF